MYLKFIGQDGSMGLRRGEIYKVKITSNKRYMWVNIGMWWSCPYSSPQTLAENWVKP